MGVGLVPDIPHDAIMGVLKTWCSATVSSPRPVRHQSAPRCLRQSRAGRVEALQPAAPVHDFAAVRVQQDQSIRRRVGRMGSGCRQLFNHANDHTPSCVLGADLYQVGSNCFLKRSNALRSCLPGRCEGLASLPAALRASAARARRSTLASVSS